MKSKDVIVSRLVALLATDHRVPLVSLLLILIVSVCVCVGEVCGLCLPWRDLPPVVFFLLITFYAGTFSFFCSLTSVA